MRLWSLHPKYLDPKGLIAVWREALLAKNVLQGKTKGYKNHPQLERFKNHPSPIKALNYYLLEIYNEATKRNYNFDKNKISKVNKDLEKIKITSEQIKYEFEYLKKKLEKRNIVFYKKLLKTKNTEVHSIFTIVRGNVEDWEKQIPKISHVTN